MKRISLLILTLTLATLANLNAGPVPPPEKLLPQDTLAFLTVPDWAQAAQVYERCPGAMLWKDPAMKPFKDKFVNKLTKDVLEPFEKELGIKFSDYSGLAQGQITIALTGTDWIGNDDQHPGFLLLMDAKGKSEQLSKSLADLKKRWVDAGKQIKTDKIRNVEFTTLIIASDEIKNLVDKIFPDPTEGWESLSSGPPRKKKAAGDPGKKLEFIVGQSDTLLIFGSSPKEIEKILVLQTGGGAPALTESSAYQADHNALFRDATSYGWINLKLILEVANKALAGERQRPQNSPIAMDPKQAISALGFNGLRSAALAVKEGPEGTFLQLFLGVPEAERKGLFKIFVADAKDAGPAPLIPADAVKFTRWRLSVPKAWENIEKMINDMNPAILGTLKFFEQALKQQDPNFDFKRSLIENVGDDLIVYEKNPRETTLDALTTAPTLVLLGSPNAEQLASTIKALSSFSPTGRGGGANVKEREFQGRKICSFPPMPRFNMQGQRIGERTLSYCASAGYVAISFDNAILEEYLRNGGNPPKALRGMPALMDAAQKIGGMNGGLFGYENQHETSKTLVEVLKKDGNAFAELLGASPFGARLGLGEDIKAFKDWLDFSLLPNFDKISKYFGLTVYGGSASAEGLNLKFYTPYPPQFR